MSEERKEKILKACELVKNQKDRETDLTSIVAQSMQVGYEMGCMAGERKPEEQEA